MHRSPIPWYLYLGRLGFGCEKKFSSSGTTCEVREVEYEKTATRSCSAAAFCVANTSLEKAAIVLSILRGEISISEALRKHGVSYKTLLA